VLKLVKEKSGWNGPEQKKFHRGVAAYFCHNSYAAHVVDMTTKGGQPYVERVFSAIDCGIVINPDAATIWCRVRLSTELEMHFMAA
jgi:isoquinoline 1-oxidoreductase beta subunit